MEKRATPLKTSKPVTPSQLGSLKASPKHSPTASNQLKKASPSEVAIFEDSAECVAMLDVTGRLLRMNKSGKNLLKINKFSAVRGSKWVDLWQTKERSKISAAIIKARKGQTQKITDVQPKVATHSLWWNMTIIPVLDPNNALKYLLVMCHDITERKETELALEYYALLVENVSDAIISADMNLNILSWNKGAETLYGWQSKEVMGKSARQFITTVFPNNDHEAATKQILAHGSWRGEIKQSDRRGQMHDLLSTLTLLKDKDGKNVGIVGVNKDITEQNKITTKLQQAELQRQLIKQKAKLLKQKNRELLLLNRSKDEFIAITSHQLRTPATGVKQYIGLLLEGYGDPLSKNHKLFLEKAYENNERQLHIVDDILRVAQLDLDKVRLTIQTCDLYTLIEDAAASLSAKFKTRGQQVRISKPDTPMVASVDSGQIRLALENILENASNYSGDNSKISITLEKPTAKTVVIEITDKGVGIDPADFSKLFQKFSRIRNPRSNSTNGTGLGLYFTKKIITLHKGEITVKSALSKGTTFTITLPAHR